MYTLIDSHAHVHFPVFSSDVDEAVLRATGQGIGLITVGTKWSTSVSAVEFAKKHEGVWATIGLHPGHVHDHGFVDEHEESISTPEPENAFDAKKYATLVDEPEVIAIGEFGLDYSRIPDGMDVEQFKKDQQDVARQQMRFATLYKKPIVIHCRGGQTDDVTGAHEDMRRLITEELERGGLERRGVIHCFTGTVEDAAAYRELGFLISITGIVTFARSLAATVREVPLSQLMIETDCPYLSPAPHRGKRNEPANVVLVAQAIADIHGVAFSEVSRVTTENAVRLFGLY